MNVNIYIANVYLRVVVNAAILKPPFYFSNLDNKIKKETIIKLKKYV